MGIQSKPTTELSLGKNLLSAGTAACVADCITFPLDTAKVRLMVNSYCFYSRVTIHIYKRDRCWTVLIKREREREREKGALRPINANRLYTDE